MNKIITQYHQTPCGQLILGSINNELCLCDWVDRKSRSAIDKRLRQYFNADMAKGDCAVIAKASVQIDEYFVQKRHHFSIPLVFAGTDFQRNVWQQLQLIPFGTTVSYLQLAKMLDAPKAVRAVANANGANALSIFVPCHRIIGSNGQLTGYAGGLNAKQSLLSLEQCVSSDPHH